DFHVTGVQTCALPIWLVLYKSSLKDQVVLMYETFCKENGQIGKGKGNATFYNFDRSIKVEVSVDAPVKFDEMTIELAKAKLDERSEERRVGRECEERG